MDLSPASAPPATAATGTARRRWTLALQLSAGLSLAYFLLGRGLGPPVNLAFAWAPAAAVAVTLYLLAGRSRPAGAAPIAGIAWRRPLVALLVLAAITIRAMLGISPDLMIDDPDKLTAIHLPALAWLTLGWTILGPRASASDVFASVLKSFEAVIVAGLMAGAGAVFALITFALFGAIGLELPDFLKRYLAFGGPGLIPVLAVATVYDPDRSPSEQPQGQGLARVIFTTGRLFLPLTLLVLAVYLIAIPFRFMEPFRNRNALVVFNVLLFAVVALVVVATPQRSGSLAPGHEALLRRGIVAVAALATVVSLYAMSAVIYRTVHGGLTMNRLTVIGWNTVNIVTLVWMLIGQARAAGSGWIEASHRAFRLGLLGYSVWTGFVLVAIPLIWKDRW